jgi:protein gp37
MMAENTKIEWCDMTFNHVRGCTKVSDGCKNCYAETMSGRNPGTLGIWGPNGTRVVASEAMWKQPVKWDREAKAAGERHRVFCASLADVFEDWAGSMVDSNGSTLYRNVDGSHWRPWPGTEAASRSGLQPLTISDVRARLFRLIDATPNLDWLLLTKRPENFARMMPLVDQLDGECVFPSDRQKVRPNVWLGVSVENQKAADERIPLLLQTPAAVRFVSAEPLLGPVDLKLGGKNFGGRWKCSSCGLVGTNADEIGMGRCAQCGHEIDEEDCGIHWIICGGESGHGARPMNISWVKSIIQQCEAAGTSVFIKQLGSRPIGDHPGCLIDCGCGLHNGFHDRKGGDISEFPIDLQVREFPV